MSVVLEYHSRIRREKPPPGWWYLRCFALVVWMGCALGVLVELTFWGDRGFNFSPMYSHEHMMRLRLVCIIATLFGLLWLERRLRFHETLKARRRALTFALAPVVIVAAGWLHRLGEQARTGSCGGRRAGAARQQVARTNPRRAACPVR